MTLLTTAEKIGMASWTARRTSLRNQSGMVGSSTNGSNSGFIHPMAFPWGAFSGCSLDGQTLPPSSARYQADNVGPGQRHDVIWKVLQPGKWLIITTSLITQPTTMSRCMAAG